MQTLPPLSVTTRSVTSAAQAAPVPQNAAAEPDFPAFSPGQTLRAVVVAKNADNQFMLETGGSRFVVQSRAPLSPGQALNLQVLSTEPKIELQIIEDTTGRFFNRSLASTGSNANLSSFLTLLRQVAPSQLSNVSTSSQQALQQFSLLQQQQVDAAQQDGVGQAPSPSDYGPKLLQGIFTRLEEQMAKLFAEGKAQAVPAAAKAALQDIALLFQGKGQLSKAAAAQLEQLGPQAKQLFEMITLLQNKDAGREAKEAVLDQLLQNLQLQPNGTLKGANTANALTAQKSGLAELFFLLKGPENLLQLFSSHSLRSGLLPQAQAEAILLPQSGTGGNTGGGLLQQLVAKLGLNLEGMLAAGNREDAVKTVKLALMELVQNAAGESRLTESGKHALKTLEFFQLTQLQAVRQEALVVPLPLPFLDQGFLVVEDYQDQPGKEGKSREMPSHFSLFLKLQPLGNLKIEFVFGGDGLYIRFHSESKEVSAFLATFKDEIKGAISDTLVQGVSFTENGEDPLAAVLKKSRAGAESLIKTRA